MRGQEFNLFLFFVLFIFHPQVMNLSWGVFLAVDNLSATVLLKSTIGGCNM